MAYAQTAKKVLSSKGVQTTLTYVAIAVAVYIAYRLMAKTIKGLAVGVADLFDANVNQTLDSTESQDETSMTDAEEQAFKAQAKAIANGQEQALNETGFLGMQDPDEEAIFTPLMSLNGAQLRQVYGEYGVRQGRTLFEEYQAKLSGSILESFTYYDDRVVNCTSYFDDCNEVEFARAIWQKSGIPTTF